MTGTATAYQPSLTAAVAREHVNDLVRAAAGTGLSPACPAGMATGPSAVGRRGGWRR